MFADVYLNFFFHPIPAIPVACLYAEGLMKQTGMSANRQFVSFQLFPFFITHS